MLINGVIKIGKYNYKSKCYKTLREPHEKH